MALFPLSNYVTDASRYADVDNAVANIYCSTGCLSLRLFSPTLPFPLFSNEEVINEGGVVSGEGGVVRLVSRKISCRGMIGAKEGV
jgi:hypothetical protein